MSSYQFVNSLANCYGGANGQQQQRPPGVADQQQSALAAVAAVHAAAAQQQDYYGASSGYAAAAGPPPGAANCYSPQVSPHYGPYAPAAAAPTPQTHPLQGGGSAADYNPQLAAAAAHQRLSAATGGLQSTTSPGAPTPPSATPVNNSACKYADSTASSPQDLSTSSGNTPAPQASRSPADPAAVAAAAAGHQSSASSTASNNNSGGSSGKGPPHIYPWMKRVHLGTSEYFFLQNFQFSLFVGLFALK